jgi:hypothetical protein
MAEIVGLINQWHAVANERACNRKTFIFWLLRPQALQFAAVFID